MVNGYVIFTLSVAKTVCELRYLGVGTTGFVLSLSWISSVTAGHTKRVTTNAIMLIAYCIGNAAAPFMWQAKYQPRYVLSFDDTSYTWANTLPSNHVPWIIIGICYVVCPMILLMLRYILQRENRIRDNEPVDETYDDVYIEVVTPEGKRVEQKVPKVSCLWVYSFDPF